MKINKRINYKIGLIISLGSKTYVIPSYTSYLILFSFISLCSHQISYLSLFLSLIYKINTLQNQLIKFYLLFNTFNLIIY